MNKARGYTVSIYNPISTLQPQEYFRFISKHPVKKSSGASGFKNKKHLLQHLQNMLLGLDDKQQLFTPLSKKELQYIKKRIDIVVRKSQKLLPSNPEIHIFLSNNESFVKDMRGVNGFTPWKNVFHVYINKKGDWKRGLDATIAHEYCHSAMLQTQKWETLLDSFIFEGFAEVFQQIIVPTFRSPWSKALKKNEALKIFKKLGNQLNSTNPQLHNDIFFGSKKYKQWTGYAVGYWVVKEWVVK